MFILYRTDTYYLSFIQILKKYIFSIVVGEINVQAKCFLNCFVLVETNVV